MEYKMANVLAILQARFSSSRLPGKVFKPILGKPMLLHQIERVLRSRKIDQFVVATSTDPSDDDLEILCRRINVPCFRGSLNDVLDRFYQAAKTWQPHYVVRLTGDCPLIDPEIIDSVIDFCLAGSYDYASNATQPTFPDGLDSEIFRFSILQQAWEEATLPSQREHVTPFIHGQPERFFIGHYRNTEDLSHLRWTVDEQEDFDLVTKIYEALYPVNPEFRMNDVITLLQQHPELAAINQKIERNEGLKKSLNEDMWHKTMERLNLRKSLALQEHAKKRIPGLSQLLSKRPDLYSYGVWPGYFSKAKGVEVWDLDENRYIDMSIGGIGATVLGYGDEDVDAAVRAAIDKGVASSLNCSEEIELADLLCELHPWAEMVRYARTGGESMAVAVRIARAYTGRDKIAFCGYHGWHDWYLSANLGTENALGEHLISGLEPRGVPKVLAGTALPFKYNKIDELRAIFLEHSGQIAAIVMEPIRSDWPVPGFFDMVRELARDNQSILIIDEISAGFRMNSGGAHLKLGVEPDIAVFSKALGNGYPIAAIIGKTDVMGAAQSSFISSTNWTERVGPAAAIATIRKHQLLNVGEHLMEIGTMIQEGWKRLSKKHDLAIHVSGIPPLSHFVFIDKDEMVLKALYVQWMLERGFLASTSFYSMYAHRKEHVEAYLCAADEVFALIGSARTGGDPRKELLGQPAVAGFKRLN